MSDEVKSALDIAKEKAEKLGEITEEERLTWKYLPEGEKLAARYLKENITFSAELNAYDEKARKYVVNGAAEILVRNISLPRNEVAKKTNKKAMEGIKALKTDKVVVENAFSRIRRVFEHYVQQGEQQKREAYEGLKMDFAAKIEQALRQQGGSAAGMRIDVERQPQFQEEWRKLLARLESQYVKLLDEYKQELRAIE